jgi:hypothetical protein
VIEDKVTILVGTTILAHVYPPDHLKKVIGEKQIERITFHYTALDGKLKELRRRRIVTGPNSIGAQVSQRLELPLQCAEI